MAMAMAMAMATCSDGRQGRLGRRGVTIENETGMLVETLTVLCIKVNTGRMDGELVMGERWMPMMMRAWSWMAMGIWTDRDQMTAKIAEVLGVLEAIGAIGAIGAIRVIGAIGVREVTVAR